MIAQQDPSLFTWLTNASRLGGSFIENIALAGLAADEANYPILRPALMVFRDKYPKYAGADLTDGINA